MAQRKESLKYARSFRDLVVYQRARQLARDVYDITKRLPAGEAFSLTDQWRRASRSIGGQIAEAWAKRQYVRHFASKLTDADAEQQETQHWIITALDCDYITREEARLLGSLCQEIGRMLNQMIENADAFCGNRSPSVREESIYIAESPSDY
jgi:four helix bundle protein